MFLYILLIFTAFVDASIFSATYNDVSCSSISRIAFHYDNRENANCTPIACSPIGDGNFYEVRCDVPLSSLDNPVFASVNYYNSMADCNQETTIMAYGGIPNNELVKIYHQASDSWISLQFITIDTAQFTLCNVTDNIPTCATQYLALSCALNLNLEAGFYWKYTEPASIPSEAPLESPISAPDPTDEVPSDPLPSVPSVEQYEAPTFVETPVASTIDIPIAHAPERNVIRCNCNDLSQCRCHMSCQMVDDAVTCALG